MALDEETPRPEREPELPPPPPSRLIKENEVPRERRYLGG